MDRGRGWLVAMSLVSSLALTGCTTDPSTPPGVGSNPDRQVPPLGWSDLVSTRAAHTATKLRSGAVLVAGGCVVDGCSRATGSTALLAIDGDARAAAMEMSRDAHTATLLETGEVLITGGFSREGRPPLAGAEIFEPRSGSWTPTRSMRLGRGGHDAARLGDGRVVVVGGWIGPQQYTATTEIYDPATERFTAGPRLPKAADGVSAVGLADGSVLVAGGQVKPGRATAGAVIILSDGTMAKVGPMLQPRFKHTMVRLRSGRVLVIGGTSNDEDLLASTEIYDPRTHRFVPGPTMSAGRYKLNGSATLLPDGQVVVAGGGPGMELIDVKKGTSRRVSGLGSTRASFSTTSIVGSTVRVIGGYDRDINLTRTNETIPLTALR